METLSPEVLDQLRHGRAPRERKIAVCTAGAHLSAVDRAEILCVLSEDPDEVISTRAQEAMLSIAPEVFVEAVTRETAVAALFSYGQKDYYLGGSPLWQMFRVTYRLVKKPYIVGGLALLLGYVWAAIRRVKRPVSPELMKFNRSEQMKKLKGIFRSLLRMKKVKNFSVATRQGQA